MIMSHISKWIAITRCSFRRKFFLFLALSFPKKVLFLCFKSKVIDNWFRFSKTDQNSSVSYRNKKSEKIILYRESKLKVGQEYSREWISLLFQNSQLKKERAHSLLEGLCTLQNSKTKTQNWGIRESSLRLSPWKWKNWNHPQRPKRNPLEIQFHPQSQNSNLPSKTQFPPLTITNTSSCLPSISPLSLSLHTHIQHPDGNPRSLWQKQQREHSTSLVKARQYDWSAFPSSNQEKEKNKQKPAGRHHESLSAVTYPFDSDFKQCSSFCFSLQFGLQLDTPPKEETSDWPRNANADE